MSQPIFQVKNLVKEFTVGGGFGKEEIFRALHGVSFDLHAGKTLERPTSKRCFVCSSWRATAAFSARNSLYDDSAAPTRGDKTGLKFHRSKWPNATNALENLTSRPLPVLNLWVSNGKQTSQVWINEFYLATR